MSHTSHTYITTVPDISKLNIGDAFCLGSQRIKVISTCPLDIHLEGCVYVTRKDWIQRFVDWHVPIERPIAPPPGHKIIIGKAGTWLPKGSFYWHSDKHKWEPHLEAGYVTLEKKLYATPLNVGPIKRRTITKGYGTYIDVDGALEEGVLVEVRVIDEPET